jgi:hypothetical protein
VAAFRVELTTEDGEALPENTELSVRYQGRQSEGYTLAEPPTTNEDVCCRPAEPVSGALPEVKCLEPVEGVEDASVAVDAAPADAAVTDARAAPDAGPAPAPTALHCELWTNGIAEITITAEGYTELVQTLQAEAREDECGLETVDERLVLTRQDGGS